MDQDPRVIDALPQEAAAVNGVSDFDIAIIGMAGRFPGARNLDEFWQNLVNGVEAISSFSEEEVIAAGVDPALAQDAHYVKAGGVLEDAELFDARFFGVYPREAEIMDPQHRVFLEIAWTALEHAGYDPSTYPGMIGVFAGAGMNTYLHFNLSENRAIRETVHGYQLTIANDKDFLPTRVSYKLNLRGPSVNVQTACSTSLVATHLACQALLNFQCDMALAGGASVRVPQQGGYLYQEGGIASPDGHCRAFDADAAGTIGGNGVAAVVLKRLTDAIADGDTVHAVIKGSAINNDGSQKVGYTAPSIEGQAQVIATALAVAQVDPRTVQYIEAHGTGTAIGDPIEITALTQAFRASTPDTGFCAIGSLKTNVGHLDAAAGVGSLIKTALALEHRQIPPSINFTRPNPRIDFASSPFYVNSRLTAWESGARPRRAGVSSFGIGGTNAHAVLEEAPDLGPTGPSRAWQLLVVSAKTPTALEAITANLALRLAQEPTVPLPDVAYTLQVGRKALEHRRIAVCRDRTDAAEVLATRAPGRVLTGAADAERRVAFMFSGQGAQYPNMGRGLYDAEPVFRDQVDQCARLLQPHLGYDIRALLYPPAEQTEAAEEKLRQTAVTQPALFVVEYALAQLWLAWGIRPDALIGHSIGEYVAACLAGVMSLADALALIAARGRLMGALPGGAMLSVPLSETELRARLREHPALALAAVNAPALCVAAGPTQAVDALEHQLTAEGLSARRLHTSHAFHSAMMDPILSPFTEIVRRITLHPPQIPYLSNVTGHWITAEEATDPAYYAQHLRSAVRFGDGVAALAEDAGRVLLEVGPGRTLTSLARAHPAVGLERPVLSSLRRPQEEQEDQQFALSALGQMWLAGVPPDWQAFYAGERRRRVPLPAYPFERERYWVAPTPGGRTADRGADAMPRKQPDPADWFYLPSWRRMALPAATARSKMGERWLVFSDDPTGGQAAGGLRAAGAEVITVSPGAQFSPTEHGFTVRPGDRDDYERLAETLKTADTLPAGVAHLWTLPAGPNSDAAEAQARGFESLLALAQAWGKHGGSKALRIVIVTSGVFDVTGDEVLAPERAPVLGAIRVIPQEYPNITCRIIDAAAPDTVALVAELTGDAMEPVVAHRGRRRWVQAFEPARPGQPQTGEVRLRECGVYLITGGLGRIGGLLAEHLARTAQARLALLDRTALPERAAWDAWLAQHEEADPTARKIAQMRRIEALGGEVLLLVADVADPAQMAAAIAQIEARFGALHGVIHAAGVVGQAAVKAIAETGRAERQAQFRPKVAGTLALANGLADRPLDFVILQSSISTTLGGLGFAAYAAANSFMDAFAAAQSRAGGAAPWISAAWDGWQLPEADLSRLPSGAAAFAITPEEGVAAFDRLLTLADQPQILIATADLPARLARWTHRAMEAETPAASAGGAAPSAGATRHPRPNLHTAYVAPNDAVESAITAAWEQVLGLGPIGVHDDFFELGGHSLLATQLVSQLRDTYQVDVPLRKLFETPTVAGLAGLVHAARRVAAAGAADAGAGALAAIPRIPHSDNEALPLSFGQQRLWFLDQLDPGSPLYNNFAAVQLNGALDPARLENSLNAVVRRHEILRAVFDQREGVPVQRIRPALPLQIPVTDLRDLPDNTAQRAEIQRLALAEARRPFHLDGASPGPLLRAQLLRTGAQEHVLFFTMHHIVSDGWSVGVLIREIAALYQADGRTVPLAELPIQYADVAAWQRAWLAGPERDAQLAYWREQLSPEPEPLALPTDRPRPAVQTSRGANIWFDLSRELYEGLEALSKREGVTLFMTLLAGLQTLLARYTGQDDICIGTPIANRSRSETEGLIGFLLNTLVLRSRLADAAGAPTFRALLAQVKEVALGAYAHQDLPFEMLVETLQPARDMSRSPFFQVMFDLQAAPLQALSLPGVDLTVRPLRVDSGTAKFDLALSMEYGPDGLGGFLNYNTDLFDADTAERMVDHFRVLLAAAVADPNQRVSELPLLTAAERTLILDTWNNTATGEHEMRTAAQMFEAQAQRQPEAAALLLAEGVEPAGAPGMTYDELNRRTNQLAHYLRDLDVAPDQIVGIAMERSLDMIVAILGVLKAGGAFLPLDPAYPPERLRFMLEDTDARVLLTQERVRQRLNGETVQGLTVRLDADWPEIAQSPVTNLPIYPSTGRLAYVIYTSGSTGMPKGVLIEQDTLAQHLHDVAAHFGLRAGDRVLQFAALTFDQALEQILATLISGGTLVVRGTEIWPPADLPAVIANYGLNVINLPPAYWHQALQEWAKTQPPLTPGQLKLVISGGDVLSPESLRLWQQTPARTARLLNAYGPTETTVTATTFDVPGDWFERSVRPVPIGRPLPNRTAYILDTHGQPVPIGVPGELFLGGIGVARGYLNRPELSTERFVPNPFAESRSQESGVSDLVSGLRSPAPGARLYRTGDLARYLRDGNIEFLGRNDRQVKIRGFRVELGEIEAALAEHAGVGAAVVEARGESHGQKRLVAYIVPAQPAAAPAAANLRAHLGAKLPAYMTPAAFVFLTELPLTASGKVNRRALPAPDEAQSDTPYVAPRTPIEADLAAIWGQVLGVTRIGVEDNFFDLGGHSLLATQILARIREIYPLDLSLRRLFETPTVAGLADAIEQGLLAQADEAELAQLLRELEELSDDEARDLLAGSPS